MSRTFKMNLDLDNPCFDGEDLWPVLMDTTITAIEALRRKPPDKDRVRIRDLNGNTVGHVWIEESSATGDLIVLTRPGL